MLFRGQLGVSLTFTEEMYSRNLGNLFVSPLRLYAVVAGQRTMSLMRTLIGVGGACAFAFLLFNYSIFSMGLPSFVLHVPARVRLGVGLAVSAMILALRSRRGGLAWDLSPKSCSG